MTNTDLQIARNGIARSIRRQRTRARQYAGTQWADYEHAVLFGLRLGAAGLKGIRRSTARSRSISRHIAADIAAGRYV